MKKRQLSGDLMAAIARLPPGHYVTFSKERSGEDPDDDQAPWLLTACVFQAAPKEGWASRGARFRHPPSAPSHQEPCPSQWLHDDAVIFGVNGDLDKPEVLERLLIEAITRHWGSG